MIETRPLGLSSLDQVEDQRALLGAHRRERLVEQQDLVGVARETVRRPRSPAAGRRTAAASGTSTLGMLIADLVEACARELAHLALVEEAGSEPRDLSRRRNRFW